jgi:hypothetical protein
MLGSTPRRRLLVALALWAVATAIVSVAMPTGRLSQHTPYNHFALLAESMLRGRLDLPDGAPAYTGNNDFASYAGKTWVVFPAFPAILMLPGVALAGSAERFRDGVFFLWLAGLGPALFFLALERLADAGLSLRSERENIGLAALLGLGTVYFFTAVQGTVWFGAHVVGVALAALYVLASVEGRSPVLAGLALGLGFFTRTPLVYAFPFFVSEVLRVAQNDDEARLSARHTIPSTLLRFAAPIAVVVAFVLFLNHRRFGDPFEFGYRYLTIGWQARIQRWGLFSYHYLGRNLAVIASSLPFTPPPGTSAPAPFQISAHGLALWFTTPVYLTLFRATAGLQRGVFRAFLLTALCVAVPSLFYQNTGQWQFGYRFSNDFAVFLLAALAVSSRQLSKAFWGVAAIGVAVNTFGALTFDHPRFQRFYANNAAGPIHQPD